MEWEEWAGWYERIKSTLNYSIVDDSSAATLLSTLIKDRALDLERLRVLIEGKDVIVFGAGPSLLDTVSKICSSDQSHTRIWSRLVFIAADGASRALIEHGIRPDVVVTDLDGDHGYLLCADTLGSVMVVHAHGDNINLIKFLVPKFKNIIGTTQVKPLHNVYNFGGFTDGDRAVFIANAMNARSITLAGMDLGSIIGQYSKPNHHPVNSSVKVVKMRFAKQLLEHLASHADSRLYNLSPSRIEGFSNIAYEDLLQQIKD
ncbi:MAG: 6-hydroxymethylpterin diphosphokinase MptE-like protein [Candidatus Nitrosocaldus sp.]